MSTSISRAPLAAVLATAALVLAACGSGSSDAGSSSSSGSGGDAVSQYLAEHSKPSADVKIDFPAVTGAAAALKGKTIFYIPILTNPPLFQSQTNLLKKAAAAVGMTVTVCNGNANPADITSCFNQAISSKAAGIISDSIPPQLAPQAYAHVVSSKTPTVALNINEPVPSEYTSMVSSFDRQEVAQGKLSVDQIIKDSGGKADVLLVALNDSNTTTNTVKNGILPEFKAKCPKCTVSRIDLNSSQVGSVPSLVSTGLVQHPNATYVFAEYDVLAQGAQQGIRQQQKTGSVKLVSINGTLGSLQAIESGAMFADTGNDINFEAWSSVDMLIRQILGKDPMADEHGKLTPLRTYTKVTMKGLKLTTSEYEGGTWFGDPTAYESAFTKLWGGK